MKYSIVIPMYNAELTIADTLISILEQRFPEFEVVVVDDFSDDDSWGVVKSMKNTYPNLKLIRNTRKGANHARQIGVAACVGEYVLFLDSDDRYSLDALFQFDNVVETHSIDLVCANMSLIDEFGVVLKERVFNYKVLGLCSELYNGKAVAYQIPPSACAKLFKADVLKGIDFVDVPFAQDWNITYKYLAHCKNVFFLDESVYEYIKRQSSTSTHLRTDGHRIVEACESIKDILKYWSYENEPVRGSGFIRHIAFRFYLNIFGRIFSLYSVDEQRALYKDVSRKLPAFKWSAGVVNCVIRSPGEFVKYIFFMMVKAHYSICSFLFGRLGR
jgi:glycosyltransferase involved in cell wall biosynthesis